MSTLRFPPVADPASAPSGPSDRSPIDREREILRELARLVAERAAGEAEVERFRSTGNAAADRDYRERRQALIDRNEGNLAAARADDVTRRRTITDASIAGENSAKDEFARASRKLAAEFDALREQARGDHTKAKARATAEFEAGEREAASRYGTDRKPIEEAYKLIESRRARLASLFEDYRHFGLPEAPTVPSPTRGAVKAEDQIDKIFDRLQKVEPNLALLEGLVIPKSMKGRRYLWIFAILALILVAPLILYLGPAIGLVVTLVIAIGGGFFLKMQLYKLSATQVSKFFYPLSQTMVDAEAIVREARAATDERLKQDRLRVAGVRDEALAKAKAKQSKTIHDGEADRDERLRLINEVYAQRKLETQTKLAREMREAVDAHDKRMAELPIQHETSTKKLDEKYQGVKEKIRNHHESSWRAMSSGWLDGMARVRASLDQVTREIDAYAPRWDDPLLARPGLSEGGPAPVPDRRDPSRPRPAPGRTLDRPPPEGRDPGPIHAPRPAPLPPIEPTW